jgi:hypothetical protein
MGSPRIVRQSLRAKEFYSQVCRPCYESLQNAATQTPLVIMLWGPRQRTHGWSNKRLQIRDELRRLGHTVFFSEQLGVPTAAFTKKAVEWLQHDAADLIVAMQPSYDSVGAVQHFAEFRVVESRMLLFINEAAPDEHLYHRALTELKTHYDNVETYKLPEDIIQDNLLKKIIAKVSVMQMVKHRAIQKARSWGLKSDDYAVGFVQPGATPQPFRYNLLELYREHRDEIDVLTDLTALFILAYVNQIGGITLKALSYEVGLAETLLHRKMVPLQRSEMMVESNGMLSVTGFGKRILDGVGLVAPAAPISSPRPSAPISMLRFAAIRRERMAAIARGAGLSLATAMLLILVALYWSATVQNQLPLVYTPTYPAVAPTKTHTPTPLTTPIPPIRR